MGVLSLGIQTDRTLQKAVQATITTVKPAKIPKLKGRAPWNPFRLPLDMDMRLLGPGVTAVTTA